MSAQAEVAVIGGSGFYAFLEDTEQVPVSTPYGPPSAPVTIGVVGDRRVAFLPRHGVAHEFPPHRVNYRANLWALDRLGVRRIIGPCAVGSLKPAIAPGEFMVLDQLVDRTWGRPDTYADGPIVNHVSFADPYCADLSRLVTAAAHDLGGLTVHDGGTVVVIQGPRFSTRAESNWFRAAGWDVVNMTQHPEAYLARELGMCYCGLALVTDYDTGLEGVDGIEPVTAEQVFATLDANIARTRELLFAALPMVDPPGSACRCRSARVVS
ncbi:MAG TPA: S-methyl-5'-thioadenosine phosphorylase [Acidimicrobiales bacterium]|jgi:5'-methylthioadenosine phosphorylase|nr:S-methyl-5'-thioadenosine phosphorylase [Acidimicrobiales bacterium]